MGKGEKKSVRLSQDEEPKPYTSQYDPSKTNTNVGPKSTNAFRRKSSIPFADRTPRVRFNRIETCITSLKPGPHQPIVPGTASEEELLKKIHSILKETEHPILIDLNLLAFHSPQSPTLSNDEMLLCIHMVEWQCKSITRADRQGRGSMDILSFPTCGDRVESASRIRACLMLAIDLMHRLSGELKLEEPDIQIRLNEAYAIIGGLASYAEEAVSAAKVYTTFSKMMFVKWRDLLKRKGEFCIDSMKIDEPIYREAMPENVTLFEDNTSSPYSFDGTLTFFWNKRNMTVSCDMEGNKRAKISSCTDLEKISILTTLVAHGQDLIRNSSNQLQMALEVFKEPILATGFENIKNRAIGMKFDDNFDPLCVIELKNTLGELTQRTSELLNHSEKMLQVFIALEKLIRYFDRYTKQILQGVKMKNKAKCCRICPSKYIVYEDMADQLGRMPSSEILLQMPMPTSFEMPKASIAHPDDGDEGLDDDSEEISVSSTIYRLIASSEAELRLRL